MDKDLFNQKLAELAVLKPLKPKHQPNIRLDETHQNDVRLPNGEWIHINKESNPTLGFEFVKTKEQHRSCELGCGDIIADQKIERRLCFHPKKHWKTKCITCGKYQTPTKDGFDKTGTASQQSFIKYFASRPKVQGEVEIFYDEQGREYTEVITNDSIIRKYK